MFWNINNFPLTSLDKSKPKCSMGGLKSPLEYLIIVKKMYRKMFLMDGIWCCLGGCNSLIHTSGVYTQNLHELQKELFMNDYNF